MGSLLGAMFGGKKEISVPPPRVETSPDALPDINLDFLSMMGATIKDGRHGIQHS